MKIEITPEQAKFVKAVQSGSRSTGGTFEGAVNYIFSVAQGRLKALAAYRKTVQTKTKGGNGSMSLKKEIEKNKKKVKAAKPPRKTKTAAKPRMPKVLSIVESNTGTV